MILPNHSKSREVIEALANEPALTSWERDFVKKNTDRQNFTDRQREVIGELMEKYEI
jgi:hypothetical protein